MYLPISFFLFSFHKKLHHFFLSTSGLFSLDVLLLLSGPGIFFSCGFSLIHQLLSIIFLLVHKWRDLHCATCSNLSDLVVHVLQFQFRNLRFLGTSAENVYSRLATATRRFLARLEGTVTLKISIIQ